MDKSLVVPRLIVSNNIQYGNDVERNIAIQLVTFPYRQNIEYEYAWSKRLGIVLMRDENGCRSWYICLLCI